jgi:hypothetical protein
VTLLGQDGRQTDSLRTIGLLAAALVTTVVLTACDPGYTVAVDNTSAETAFLRVTTGPGVYVYRVLPGVRGYGLTELGEGTLGVEILDSECNRIWANDLSTGTFVLTLGRDLTVKADEASVASFTLPLPSELTCGANTVDYNSESGSEGD